MPPPSFPLPTDGLQTNLSLARYVVLDTNYVYSYGFGRDQHSTNVSTESNESYESYEGMKWNVGS